MYNYVGVLATQRIDSNGNAFSLECLKDLVEKSPVVPVRINFSGSPIGKSKNFFMREDNCVICEVELGLENLDRLDVFFVPGGKCDMKDMHKDPDGTTVIDRIDLYEISITTNPADVTLTSIWGK